MEKRKSILEKSQSHKEQYKSMLLFWNQRINLISRKNPMLVFNKLWNKAERIANNLPNNTNRILDIGSGAGFPGIALKILKPDLDIILLEPRQKRFHFLLHVQAKLCLTVGLYIYKLRWEEFIPPKDWKADVVFFQGLKIRPNDFSKLLK